MARVKKVKRPVMLLFHQGAFVGGEDDKMAEQAAAARARGFKPKRVNYALSDLPQAIKDAKKAAKSYGPKRQVVAYGESAGGGLASMLASRGLVDAATTYSGVNNMSKWFEGRDSLGATPAQLRKYSASSRRSKSPILAYTTAQDPFVSPKPTRRWAKRDDAVKHRVVGGVHIAGTPESPAAHERAVRDAMKYLDRQTAQLARRRR